MRDEEVYEAVEDLIGHSKNLQRFMQDLERARRKGEETLYREVEKNKKAYLGLAQDLLKASEKL